MDLIRSHWNNTVAKAREAKPRSHMRASELGMPFIDRYYEMQGLEPSNPFSQRVLRVFDAGKVIEFVVMRVLALSGILNQKQQTLELPENERHLRVSGRLDATIGGFVDWDKAQQRILDDASRYHMDLDDDYINEKAMSVLAGLRADYPDGWPEEMVVEVKSVNSMAFHAHKNRAPGGGFMGYEHHRLQLYAYLCMTGLRQGILLYVSKDDMMVEEVVVQRSDTEIEEEFFTDLETMTKYYRTQTVPPKEKELKYNIRKRQFEINWNVARSRYLYEIYGYSDSGELEAAHHQLVLDLNRSLRHLRDGKLKNGDQETIDKYGLQKFV